MSNSVAAKTPKSGELQHHQLNSNSKVTVVAGGSSSATTKTPPVRLTRSISSKPNFEASRRALPGNKTLIKAKVKSNPSLLKNQDGLQSCKGPGSIKDDGLPSTRRFTKRGESISHFQLAAIMQRKCSAICSLFASRRCVGGLSFGFLLNRLLLHDLYY